MKRLLLITGCLLFVFLPSICFSAPDSIPAEENAQQHSISNYLFAKLMSESYAKMVNEMAYDKNGKLTDNTTYLKAKLSYQIAQNKFQVLNNMYSLLYNEKGRIFSEDEEKLAVIGRDAYKAFQYFGIDADIALNALSDNAKFETAPLMKSVPDNITMREMLKFTFANVFHPDGASVGSDQAEKAIKLAVKAVKGDIMSIPDAAALLASAYNQYNNVRNSKYGKLTTWINNCSWTSWDTIAKDVKDSRPKPVEPKPAEN